MKNVVTKTEESDSSAEVLPIETEGTDPVAGAKVALRDRLPGYINNVSQPEGRQVVRKLKSGWRLIIKPVTDGPAPFAILHSASEFRNEHADSMIFLKGGGVAVVRFPPPRRDVILFMKPPVGSEAASRLAEFYRGEAAEEGDDADVSRPDKRRAKKTTTVWSHATKLGRENGYPRQAIQFIDPNKKVFSRSATIDQVRAAWKNDS